MTTNSVDFLYDMETMPKPEFAAKYTTFTLELGNSSANPDDYLVSPIEDGMLIVTDTYPTPDGKGLLYDYMSRTEAHVGVPLDEFLEHVYSEDVVFTIHAAYVLRVQAIQCEDRYTKKRLQRLVEREVKRLKPINTLEQTLTDAWLADNKPEVK